MVLGRRRRWNGRAVAAVSLAVVLVSTLATGLGHAASPVVHAWTATKAERIVARDAVVRFGPSQRAALESELGALVREYLALENTAGAEEDDYGYLPSRLHNLRYRYSTALKAVRAGLPVATATCRGSGGASGGRYTRFGCDVVSEKLRIPVAEVTWTDGRISQVVEREPRIVGPLAARLSVRVSARSAIRYSQR